MIASGSKPKHLLIADDLRAQIHKGTLLPGTMMPSYRTLMKRHKVTVGTVRQAIQSLQSEALIETVPRVGCVVAERKNVWRHVGVAILQSIAPTQMAVLEALHAEFARMHCDVTLHFATRDSEEWLQSLIAWGKRQDGVLTIGHVPARTLLAMQQAGIRVVQCGEPIDGPCPPEVSGVAVDIGGIAALAVGHLAGLGHRHVIFCTRSGTRYFDTLTQSFLAYCDQYHIRGEVQRVSGESEEQFAYLPRWLSAQKEPPTALLVENARNATFAVGILTAHGWPVPERISVMATALALDAGGVMKDLTSVFFGTREMFLRAVDILLKMIETRGGFTRHEVLPSVYVPGKTCRACP